MPGADISDVTEESDASGPRRSTSALFLALAIVAAGAFVVFEAVTGPGNPGYAEVGPGVIPGIIGAALALAGLLLLLQSLRGEWRVVWFEHSALSSRPSEARAGMTTRTDTGSPPVNVLLVTAALILDVVLLAPLGFAVASAVLFALVAAAFGSRRFVLDAVLGLAFGGAIYLIFVHGLGLSLPPGSVWGGLPWMS